MFCKIIRFFAFLILAGCAQPKYVNEKGISANQTKAQESNAGCDIIFSKSQLCMTWSWENKPTNSNPGSIIFKTYRLNNFDQTAIQIDLNIVPTLILWMPAMGHGSIPTQTQKLDIGTYRSNNVYFIMPGLWTLKFQSKDQNGILDETEVNLEI
jgi:hypothetical protein